MTDPAPYPSVRFFLYSQKGQGMVEFLIVLPVLLLLILGAIQFALIYHAKITLNYAAYEGARSGTLGNGSFAAIEEGFIRGLAPLYSYSLQDGIHHEGKKDAPWGWWTQVTAFQRGRDHVKQELTGNVPLIRIERLNPTKASFADFGSTMATNRQQKAIPNTNLRYRSSKVDHRSNQSIQDANLLHLRYTYWYPLYVPFVNRMIFDQFICCRKPPFSLFGGDDTASSMCRWQRDPVCEQETPRIPLTAVAAMRMQTPVESRKDF